MPRFCQSLVALFNQLFHDAEKTILQGGGDEPVYLPAGRGCSLNRIIFTRDYPASALHEVAHWSIAGKARRQRMDYGYWYVPDGRNKSQQRNFEQVEIKPQAVEWILSRAAGLPFRISVDNLEGEDGASDSFKVAVWRQARDFCEAGSCAGTLPERARQYADVLATFFQQRHYLNAADYRLEDL